MIAVRAEVYESDVRHLSIGSRAEVTSRAFDGTLSGDVVRIGQRIDRQTLITEDPAAATDARVLEVRIRLDPASSAKVAGLTSLQVRVSLPRGVPPATGAPGA